MKFSDFEKQDQVEQILGLRVEEYFFTPGRSVESITPTLTLLQNIDDALLWPSHSELVLRETLISPVLTEVYRSYRDKLTFFSWAELKYEPEPEAQAAGALALNGVCDYLIVGRPRLRRPETPILCIVEAKKEDFETGTWQCAAELYAARLSNLRDGKNIPVYYGCVSNGRLWNFIRLEIDVLFQDTFFYSLGDLPQLLGVWRWILDKQIESLEQN